MTTQDTQNNRDKIDRLLHVVREVLGRILKRGYYGSLNIKIQIEDGSIQNIDAETIEKIRQKNGV